VHVDALRPLPDPVRSGAPTTIRPAPPARNERSLASYLLLPRPKDAPKAVVLLSAFGIGALGEGGPGAGRVGPALVCWLALELLVYQARYQWNDVRGFAADQRHPDRDQRGRLPGPIDRARSHVSASVAVVAVRLLAALGLVLVLPRPAGGILLAGSAGVFGAALLYELVRARGTGRTSEVPPPVRPALAGLWVVVGAGYAVRGLTGLALAVDLGDRPLLVGAAAVTFWASGVAYATTAWALEATAFATFVDGAVSWSADHRQAREHQLALARWLPTATGFAEQPDGSGPQPREWPALRGATALRAPWNVAVIVSGSAAALSGRLLAGPSSSGAAVGATIAGAVATVAVLLAPRRRPAAAVLVLAALACVLALAGSPRPLVGVVPWAVAVGAHLLFSSRSLSTRGRSIARSASRLRAAGRWVARALIGSATHDAMTAPPRETECAAAREGGPDAYRSEQAG
jgi:hypothetical protein